MVKFKQLQAVAVSFAVAFAMFVTPINASAEQQGYPTATSSAPSGSELQQLVAPIALYPDNLIAEVLAGSTNPNQIVEADRWLKQNKSLKGDQLASAVNQQAWDPSV